MSAISAQVEPKPVAAQPEKPEDLPRTEKQIALYYGERSEIRELIDRIRAGLPNAARIPDAGIRALATAAYAHDLDPWNGEIWVIYNEKKDPPETSIMAGVKGLRKAAKRQLVEGHHYYLDFHPILPEDYGRYGLGKDDFGREVELAEICELRRSDACAGYAKTLRDIFDMAKSSGIEKPFEAAREMLGPMPVYVGIGVVRKGEKTKMEKCQVVKKRAESEALKRAFDLPFADRVNANGDAITIGNAEEDAIEGQFQVVSGTPEDAPAADERTGSQESEKPPAPDGEKEAEARPKTEEKPEASAEAAAEEKPAEPKPKTRAKARTEEKPPAPEPAAEEKAEEKAAEPADDRPKDSGEDVRILALRRSHPSSWVVAAEWLNKAFKAHYTAGELREAVAAKKGLRFNDPLSAEDGWQTAIEVAREAAQKAGA